MTIPGIRSIPRGQAFLFVAVFLASLRQVGDYDLFFQLVVGREVLRQMAVPAEEFYILLLQGQPGHFYEWGFGVFYYLVNEVAGPIGMSLVNSFLAAAALTLVISAGLRRESAWWLSLIAAAPLLWWLDFRLIFRPETVLFLFLAIEIFLLEKFLRAPNYRLLAPLPLLAWLLVQCHPSVVFLMFVFGVYGLQILLRTPRGERMHHALGMGGIGVAMALMSLLNPYGIDQVIRPFAFITQAQLLGDVTEFLPSLESSMRWVFVAVAMTLFASLCAPSRRPVDVILALVFGILAYRYVRNIGLLVLVGAVPLTRAIDWAASRLPGRLVAAAAVAGAIALVALPVTGGRWGAGFKRDTFPEAGVEILARRHPAGNILNFYHLGSYLRWRLDQAYPVFIDGRVYSFNRALQAHDFLFSAAQGWQFALSRMRINVIMTPATLPYSGKLIPLVPKLAADPGWSLVAVEPAALTFVRSTMLRDLPRHGSDAVWRQVLEEARDTLSNNPYAEGAQQSIDFAQAMLAR